MKDFLWIFVLAIVCGIFSKQIDAILRRYIADDKKLAIAYCITGIFFLSVFGLLIYQAASEFAGRWAVALAIGPVTVFIIAVGVGMLATHVRNKKRKGD